MRRPTVMILSLCAMAAMGVLVACSEPTPEQKVDQSRARYSARLNGFFARDVPVEEPMPEEGAEPAAEPDPAADPSEEEMVAPVMRQEVTLDIIVQHDAREALPGVTVDITLVDANQNEKGAWKLWVETEGLPKANQKQLVHVLTDVGYEDGDGFNVEVRHPIPAGERGDYREYPGGG